jgi:4-amino-4-deoxy-L-arabinose transferase-like glycosyltransferase
MAPGGQASSRAPALALAGIAFVTLWRVAMLPFAHADLYTDDAQYWLWSTHLDWGYYSKPPLIAWIIRLSTAIGGSDAPFWIRLPFPLIHALTAVLVLLIARRLYGPRVGGIAGFAYIGLPAVAVASFTLSTDTPLLACFALAILAQIRLAERRSAGWALVLGAAIGIGMLAKYAMIYFPIAAALAAILMPSARIAWRDVLIAAVVALLLIAPNVAWNFGNGFTTLQHTADNTRLEKGAGIEPFELLEFWAGQFLLPGPIFFAAYLIGLRGVRRDRRAAFLALMSLPPLLIVSVQALLAGAQTNWAATGHLAALVLGVAVVAPRPRWLAAALAINLALTVALPVATVFADRWKVGDNLVLARWEGREELSLHAAEIARANGLDTLVADSRAILADFFYTLRDSGLALYAAPVEGFPPHHYAQKYPLPAGPGDVLYVGNRPPACRAADVVPEEVARWKPEEGYRTGEVLAFRVPRRCWFP